MEILASIAAFITAFFFLRGIINLARHIVGKKKKDTSLMKKKAKQSGIVFAICYVVTIVLGVMAGSEERAYSTVSTEAQGDTVQTIISESSADNQETNLGDENKENLNKEETQKDIDNRPEVAINNNEDYGEEDDDIYGENDRDIIDPEIEAQEEWNYTTEEMGKKETEFNTLLTYSYASEKKGKKIADLVEESQDASDKDFIYVSEKKKFTSAKCTYEITLDRTDYIYYGETKKDRPNGYGVIYCNGHPVYIGEFKEGVKNGYGIEIDQDSAGYGYFITYEGEYADGLREGEGVELYLESEDEEDVLDDYYYAVTTCERTILGYLDFMCNVPLFNNHIFYEGSFKDGTYDGKGKQYLGEYLIYEGKFKNGEYDGKGTLYYTSGQVHYKGEFKNGEYDGKGTLYNEDGSVKHKGKFKKGDIK